MSAPEWMVQAARDRLDRERDRERERAEKYKRAYWAVSQLKVWTNEDGKGFVFADDLAEALEVSGAKATETEGVR